jgi:hypothetical protein
MILKNLQGIFLQKEAVWLYHLIRLQALQTPIPSPWR